MKFYVHKLGCPKNDVDADYIYARLIQAGHQPVKEPEKADSIIVNTCGFILPAKEESINEIIRFGELKKEGHLKTLYASGCLSQRNGDEMLTEMPELDGAFGLGALDSLAKAVTDSEKIKTTIKMEPRKLGYLSFNNRFISDDFPYSYMKISDGCNRKCSYCAIPSMRGKFRSRPMESIVNEAKYLAENGKRELILVSQEATMYGYNYKGDQAPDIIKLLKELDKIEGLDWIRLMYLFPPEVSDELIDYLADPRNKTLNYFDLPLQHVNTTMLTNMQRQIDRPGVEDLIGRIKRRSSDAVIRTTFIVGFPGESETMFTELEDYVKETEFDRMGVFTYSREDGTPAAEMSGQIDEEVMMERQDRLMMTQMDIAFSKNKRLLGKEVDVIIDELIDNDNSLGRTRADCPEVDLDVQVSGSDVKVGDILPVRIIEVEGYDIKGSL